MCLCAQAIERGGVQQSYAQVLTAMSYALEHATGPASSGGMADLVSVVQGSTDMKGGPSDARVGLSGHV